MRFLSFLFLLLMISACGETVEKTQDAPAVQEQSIRLQDIFNGGNYRCVVHAENGEVEMRTKGDQIRYDVDTPQGKAIVIAKPEGDKKVVYTHFSKDEVWYKIAFAPEQKMQGIDMITPESAARYPKHECEKANNKESDFAVPEDNVVDQSELLQRMGR